MKMIRDTLILMQRLQYNPECGGVIGKMFNGTEIRESVNFASKTLEQLNAAILACEQPKFNEKFKVGDRVRLACPAERGMEFTIPTGKTGVVISVDDYEMLVRMFDERSLR
jgi:ribosomal protein L21E